MTYIDCETIKFHQSHYPIFLRATGLLRIYYHSYQILISFINLAMA